MQDICWSALMYIYDAHDLLSATAICFWKYNDVKDAPENKGTVKFAANLNYYANLKETWLALGWFT